MKKILNFSLTKYLSTCKTVLPYGNTPNYNCQKSLLYKPMRSYHQGVKNKIYLVCVTGGPCAGKTTALAEITEMFPEHIVYTLPELATLVVTAGQSLDHSQKDPGIEGQLVRKFISHMMATEDYFTNVGMHEQKDVIVLTDRGCIDPKPYSDKETWSQLMSEAGWSEDDLTNNRYDLVIHLVTAADGAVDYYTKVNNKARRETADEAKIMDKQTQDAWLNHHNFKIIHNHYGSFQGKLNKIYQQVGDLVGYNPSFNLASKFLLPDDFDIEAAIPQHIPSSTFSQQIDYLEVDNPEKVSAYISFRYNDDGKETYTHVVRNLSKNLDKRREQKSQIRKHVYRLFNSQRDLNKKTLHKKITSFNYSNTSFVVEEFFGDNKYANRIHKILRYERSINEGGIPIEIPEWLPLVKDVSGRKEYHSYSLASKS